MFEEREFRIEGGKVRVLISHYENKSVLRIEGKWDALRYDRTSRAIHRPDAETLALSRDVIAGNCPLYVLADHLDEIDRDQFAPLTDSFLRA